MSQMLVIMQGPSGSGKSTLAKTIAKMILAEICSTDDEFMVDGKYEFVAAKLPEYHKRNQERVAKALENMKSVIVDNTNLSAWQAKPYVQMAVDLGIPVHFIRASGSYPNTHGVPEEKVAQMRAAMEDLSVEACLASKTPWEK